MAIPAALAKKFLEAKPRRRNGTFLLDLKTPHLGNYSLVLESLTYKRLEKKGRTFIIDGTVKESESTGSDTPLPTGTDVVIMHSVDQLTYSAHDLIADFLKKLLALKSNAEIADAFDKYVNVISEETGAESHPDQPARGMLIGASVVLGRPSKKNGTCWPEVFWVHADQTAEEIVERRKEIDARLTGE